MNTSPVSIVLVASIAVCKSILPPDVPPASQTPIQPTVPHELPAEAQVISAELVTEPVVPDAVGKVPCTLV